MSNLRFRLQLLLIAMVLPLMMSAQSSTIIRVKTTGNDSSDGLSWENAKQTIQAAINVIATSGGEVWVAAGTYKPTETSGDGTSDNYKTFKIPAGVTVRGGFAGTETAANQRATKTAKNFGAPQWDDVNKELKSGRYQSETILSGNLQSGETRFTWNSSKQQFNTSFPGNSYHVVTFAMNGFTNNRANALTNEAKLEGCIVEGGHAYTNDVNAVHPTIGYGGGIYMVAKSTVLNCEVRKCDASHNGGGIYMDGGGEVRRTYVHHCQTLGLGTDYGFGGGICEDGASNNSKTNPIVVAQSVVTNCVGRMGGGMALLADAITEKTHKYAVVVNSTIVNNNTAQIEAGGVYTYKGGGIASGTIVNNKCIGSGITQNGSVTGRSGGVYSKDPAYIGNTVMWGNECEANENMQYASSRSSLSETDKSHFYHNALSNADLVDWSGADRLGVLSLENTNTSSGSKSTNKGFPLFFKPTTAAGYLGTIDAETEPNWTNWQVSSESYLTFAGINTADLDNEGLTPAPPGLSYDMQASKFSSRPTIGALVTQIADVAPATDVTYEGVEYDYAYFVDPQFIYAGDNPGNNGGSWDLPARFLGNILDIVEGKSGEYAGMKVAIFVKQGTVNNTRSGNTSRVRVTSLEIPSNVTIIGSFNSSLTGTDVSLRNPILTPTIISAKLMKDYQYNVAHLININNKTNITVDGFKLTFANAYSTQLTNTNQDGAAITLKNSTGVSFKNITVSNCYGDKGTVVYADATTATFENCIFHNNTNATFVNNGLVYGTNASHLSFNHCNVLRSVGHASYLSSNTTNEWKNSMFYGNLDQAQENTNDCDTRSIAAFEGDGVKAANLTGERCMFDLVSRPLYDNRDPQYSTKGISDINLGAGIPGNSTYYVRNTYVAGKVTEATETNPNGLEYEYHSGWANGYPRMVNPTKNAGYSTDGDVTYYGRATSFEPHNDNPVVNAASTNGSAHTSPLPSDVWGKDITTVATRDYGGLPDIGAVESKYVPAGTDNENANPDGQPEYGRAMYVRDYRTVGGEVDYTAGGSGMSWQDAINGNAYYYVDGHHGSDRSREINHEITVDVTTYSEGSATTIPNSTNGVLMKNGKNYLRFTGNGLTTTTKVEEATMFKVVTSGRGYQIKAITADNSEVGLGYNNGNFVTNSSSTWTIDGNTSSAAFYYTYSSGWRTNTRYLGGSGVSSTKQTWTFFNRDSETHQETRTVKETVTGINGLQFAVNSRYQDYSDQGKLSNKGVYVAAGTYTNATAKDPNSVEQPYAYMMQEGVDVYGGFPAIGNPGMDQRQPKEYITILQAQKGNPFVTMTFQMQYSGGPQVSSKDIDRFVVSNWGANANANNANDQASVGRVLVQPKDFAVETAWDGFTLQHGYLNTAYRQNIYQTLTGTGGLNPDGVKVAGGAGALLQGNGVLVNSVVKNNLIVCVPRNNSHSVFFGDAAGDNSLYTNHIGGAGIFMTGSASTAKVENCEIGSNQLLTKAQHASDSYYDHIWQYGAGLYQNGGNVYNTIIHDNTAAVVLGSNMVGTMAAGTNICNEMILGAGAFIANGNFYNNTIVANTSATFFHAHKNHVSFSGVHVFDNARIYNSLIADNIGHWAYENFDRWGGTNPGSGAPVSAFGDGAIDRNSRQPSKVNVKYSFVDVKKKEVWEASGYAAVAKDMTYANDPDNTNIYLNYKQFEAYKTGTQPANIYQTENVYYKKGASDTTSDNIYRLKSGSPCINTGTTDVKDARGNSVRIPDFDAGYDDRIQDCKIDIGAYESDGMATLHPQADDVKKQAVFYVSPDGFGRTDGSDPENAACAPKLQRIIDAAGRYKIEHPDYQVIVKVANSYSLLHPANPEDATDFTYYATRTTDQGSTDTRLWSIQIPRGVEVWGGYTDVPTVKDGDNVVKNTSNTTWSNTNNGFTYRSITGNPTYFNSSFYNKDMKINATTYHVVTFTERVYDADGKPYLASDYNASTHTLAAKSSYDGSQREESAFLHMNSVVSGNVMANQVDGKTVSNRAVLDGIFVTGGNADGKSLSGTSNLNANGYGGAAIVTDYAYVRNCIVMNNSATNGGGLALTNGALVSGSLIIQNNANDMGGGLYIFENGTTLSNGIKINSTAPTNQPMDYNMAHVLTSTIVANNADEDGGGVWYTVSHDANVRFNSVAIWQNESGGQTNVHGTVNPEQPTEDETLADEFYPFAYSVIQNMRASGTDNQSVEPLNNQGIRFVDKKTDVGTGDLDQFNMAEEKNEAGLANKLADFGYYGLTTYSMLCSTGMPADKYTQLMASIAIAEDDILGVKRIDPNSSFVEVGARALAKVFPNKQLMLRLFVARPQDVDTKTAGRFMRLSQKSPLNDVETYYSQEGSSFAYPFNSLQDALDYIKYARDGKIIAGAGQYDAQNLPFEIIVGKGTYYPRKDLNGGTKSVWSQTFAIPEGVTIIGGFDPQGGAPAGGMTTYYGRYYKKGTGFTTDGGSIYDNVDIIPTDGPATGANEIGRGNKYGNETLTLPATAGGDAAKTITFQQWDIQDIADRRGMNDNNKNGIIEPWEFKNQTIISGNAVNGETDGVYHVMTAVADEDAVGRLPMASKQTTSDEFTGYAKAIAGDPSEETGYQSMEEGQTIRLNGLIITGGNALTYLNTALDDYGSYIFYQGAGLQIDGNRYKNNANTKLTGAAVFHNSAAYGVGYRDIPVSIINCQFRNNKAGYGGAISSNGTLDIFASSFEQNIAIADTETPKQGETWTTNVDAHNPHQTVSKVMYPGQGGAILATDQLSCFNVLFANNEARLADGETKDINLVQHPTFRVPVEANASATLRAAGGAIMVGSAGQFHLVNCDFVRNKANAYPVVFTMNPTKQLTENTPTPEYSQMINTVAWGNEVNKISDNADYLRASKLMVNIGKKTRTQNYITSTTANDFYDPSFTAANVPSAEALASTDADTSGDWQEAAWFCAYEEGVGFAPKNTANLSDAINYNPLTSAPSMIKAANSDNYQNCNILIVAENRAGDGPNFGNPSIKAGFDGFTEGADWSPMRESHLVDAGNGWIKQTVNSTDLSVTFNDAKDATDTYQGAYSVTHYKTYPEYMLWTAIGNEKYMAATNIQEEQELTINGTSIGRPQKNLTRISADPTNGVTKAYIDIGVYEYMKQALLKPGSEVDILWVSTSTSPGYDGQSWERPLGNIQTAIETLLKSRNGHKKEIRIMEGNYAPTTPQTVKVNGTDTEVSAFVIDTKKMNGNDIVPGSFASDNKNERYYVQSLTIKGGYNSTNGVYDPEHHQTVIKQSTTSDKNTDYLIYVADPTVRYHYADDAGYSATHDGATVSNPEYPDAATVKTMPIQVDGVTLINDQVKADGTKGSAIYYPDYEGANAPEADVTGGHTTSVGGKVVYYASSEEMEKVDAQGNHIGETVDYETKFALVTTDGAQTVSDVKLLITKTMVVGSGKSGDTSDNASAVYIGKKGGAALIYNTVFHSNIGKPLDAWNTINVNNTFGKNTGFVRLQDADGVTYIKSQIHNTAMWRNNNDGAQFSMPDVSVVTTAGDTKGNVSGDGIANFSYNSFTGGNMLYTGDADMATNNYNTGLSNTNSEILNGPNFVDPENATILSRNFDIRPSVRLLNKGNGYRTPGDPDVYTGTYADLVVNNKYDFSIVSTTDVDVIERPRIVSEGNPQRIDIGAYEFQGSLQRVLYVDPNSNTSGTGDEWTKAFGKSDLQNAVDLAAIYHINSATKDESYVFVKGNSPTNPGVNTNQTLTIRDGVTVYGSIPADYTDWHDIKKGGTGPDADEPKYNTIEEFIEDMKSQREGVASNAANKTIVTGIKTSEYTDFNGGANGETPALVDGFVVKDPNNPTAPVVDVTNTSEHAAIVIRNVVVADNDLSSATDADVNVAQISNGLIYEVLMRDNKPKGNGAVLQVSNTANTKGYAVNVTVEGKTVGADGTQPVDGEREAETQIFKSITNSTGTGTGNAVGGNAPYGAITNKGISGNFYNIFDANLNYQLTETSKYIDMCELDVDVNGNPTFLPDNLKPFVHYSTDRDILGNPRLLTNVTTEGKIDRGAFETWRVDKNFVCGTLGTNNGHPIAAHFYPHDGSVVYVMENKNLVIDPIDINEIKPTAENPGFLLVKNGASFYGNGRPVTAAYVAVERRIDEKGAVVSVPYAIDYKSNSAAVGTESTGDLKLTFSEAKETKRYAGGKRSDWQYVFAKATEESTSWENVTKGTTVAANNGVFFQPSDDHRAVSDLIRFTGKGTSLTDYIYHEDGNSKTVTLTKYDDAESTDNRADYTDELDMGWNCIGIPYLVSNYKPYETAEVYGKPNEYMMNIPHEMWLYYDGKHTPDYNPDYHPVDDEDKPIEGYNPEEGKLVNGDGGYYSVNSWSSEGTDWHVATDAEKALWVGEGIFMQTATVSDTETLTFYRPIAPAVGDMSAAKRRNVRYYHDVTGIKEVNGDGEGVELIGTEYYTTDGVRINKPQRGIVIVRELYSNGKTRTVKHQVK